VFWTIRGRTRGAVFPLFGGFFQIRSLHCRKKGAVTNAGGDLTIGKKGERRREKRKVQGIVRLLHWVGLVITEPRDKWG